MAVTPDHRDYLRRSGAITDAVIDSTGIMSTADGIAFPWQGPGLEEGAYQLRPDNPVTDDRGRVIKYVGPSGVQLPFNRLRDHDDDGPLVIVEGTKQSLAVLSHAPHHYSVYGLAGCRAWSGLPLSWTVGRDVVVMFDGDMATNRDVHDAATALREELEMAGAEAVMFARFPSHGKQGVDDVLAAMPEADRKSSLSRWLGKAKVSPGKAPSRKNDSPFFDKNGLMVQTLATDILSAQPAALTLEQHVSIYRDGVYRPDPMALMSEVSLRLGEQHRSTHTTSTEQAVKASLYRDGRLLPERTDEPLANFQNTMVDLRTGVAMPHDPAYMSRIQHPVRWDPDAACPVYEQWLMEVIPDQADDLEEVAGTMLDPSRTPSKALFAYGPSHSGKSTFLRLLVQVAGKRNTSAVTLHAMAEDRFAAANAYGKCLNSSADLSPKDVSDLSTFKMMTGEDPITANRKYGTQFDFTNTALFAFSANELPAVNESSRAYANRMKPFHFRHSFAGREDPSLEAKLREELPGIVQRWVKAYQRFLLRGNYQPTDTGVSSEFERGSDRVRQWVAEILAVVATNGRKVLPPTEATTATQLSALFSAWARDNGGHSIGRNKLMARLTSIDGVERVRIAPTKAWGLNLIVRPEGEQGFEPSHQGVAVVAETSYSLTRGTLVKEESRNGRGSDGFFLTLPPPAAETNQESAHRGTDLDHPAPVRGDEPASGSPLAPGRDHPASQSDPASDRVRSVQRPSSLPFALAGPEVREPGRAAAPDPDLGEGGGDRVGTDRDHPAPGGRSAGRVDDGTGVRGDVQPEPGAGVSGGGSPARIQDRSPASGAVQDAPARGVGEVLPEGPAVTPDYRVNPFLPFVPAQRV